MISFIYGLDGTEHRLDTSIEASGTVTGLDDLAFGFVGLNWVEWMGYRRCLDHST
jgi:hypothetical protein